MVIDKKENERLYYGLHEGFEEAFAFIAKAVKENLPVGRYEVNGDTVYAMVQKYDAKEEATVRYEGHQKYIDIQYVVDGEECVEVVDIEKTQTIVEYDEAKDAAFFAPTGKTWKGVLRTGDYGIFMPYDIHRPAMRVDGAIARAKKIVVKVKY
jgi:YhcH/YjgK/YiaL family protein